MTYSQLVAAAPPGAAEFSPRDLARLPAEARERALRVLPAGERELLEAGSPEAGRRVVRALFWTLVYHLLPSRWDELSRLEPIHPGVLARLPVDGAKVLEIGAGTGRLTVELVRRAGQLVALEPVTQLREILLARLPEVPVLDACADDVPVATGWADVTVSCASLDPSTAGPELERCTRPGGTLALVSPGEPEWFEARGWSRFSFDVSEVPIPPHDPALEAFFGPLDPPHELLLRTV